MNKVDFVRYWNQLLPAKQSKLKALLKVLLDIDGRVDDDTLLDYDWAELPEDWQSRLDSSDYAQTTKNSIRSVVNKFLDEFYEYNPHLAPEVDDEIKMLRYQHRDFELQDWDDAGYQVYDLDEEGIERFDPTDVEAPAADGMGYQSADPAVSTQATHWMDGELSSESLVDSPYSKTPWSSSPLETSRVDPSGESSRFVTPAVRQFILDNSSNQQEVAALLGIRKSAMPKLPESTKIRRLAS